MGHPIFSRLAKALYVQIANATWMSLAAVAAGHFALSWGLVYAANETELLTPAVFWYFYITTATTVGYGDYSPVTILGQAAVAFCIMPGGIALFTAIIAKSVQAISDQWRRRMQGQADYSQMTGHIVILGWQGDRTRQMVDYIYGDRRREDRKIILVATQQMENPLPDITSFVQGPSLGSPDVLYRAGLANADKIIVLGDDDSETLATALAVGAINERAHMVAHFDRAASADLLHAHCPQAECNVSISIEMLVRSAQDPGSSRVQRQLLSTLEGPTQFSVQVPDAVAGARYGHLFTAFKQRYDATLFGVADSETGQDLVMNAPNDHPVNAGQILYFMARERIKAEEIDWAALGSPA